MANSQWAQDARAKLEAIELKMEELRNLKELLGRTLAQCIDRCFEDGCQILDGAVAGEKPEASGGEMLGRSGLKQAESHEAHEDRGSCCV